MHTKVLTQMLFCLPFAALLPGQALSQTDTDTVESDRPILEEVVVSARKVDENLQDVPIAVTAFSGDQLAKDQITDLMQLAGKVPSMTIQSQNSIESEIFIRGVGTVRLNGATADASVGYFLDEVYIGRRGSSTPPIFDLERLEVLRGPQGTLFGKNVVGGALNLTTAKPQFEWGGSGYIALGDYGAIASGGHVTGPISESAAIRVAFMQNKHDGYARNVVAGYEMEDIEQYAGRASLLWNPNDDMTFQLVLDASSDTGNGPSRHAVDNPYAAGFGFITPNISSDPRTNYSPYDQYAKKDTSGITARFDWDLGSVTATYLGAIRNGEADTAWSQAGAGSPPSITSSVLTQWEDNQGLTQELRFASDQDQRWRWLVGLYYLDDDTKRRSRNTATSFLPGGPGSTGDVLDGDNEYIQRGVSKNYAIFGDVNFDLTDTMTLSIGGRYTEDRKDWDVEAVEYSYGRPGGILSTAPLLGPFVVNTDKSWSEFTPKAVLDWQFADNKLLYFSIARGFKGGGWQGGAANAVAAETPYEPETAMNYEIGFKSELFDNRLRLNLAAYYTDFQDLQVELLDDVNLVLVIANAADAVIKGLEGEVQTAVHEYVTFYASASYTEAEYKDYIDPLRGIDYSGNQIQRTPEFQGTAGIDINVPIFDDLEFIGNVQYGYQSEMYYGPDNTNDEPGYGLLDLRAGVGAPDGKWQMYAYAKNVTDELYRISVIPFAGDEVSLFGAPSTYGLRFSMNF
jgi:iron complex outermembrane receptor protein